MSCAQPAIYQITTDTNACKSDCPRECEYFEYENDVRHLDLICIQLD